MINDNIISNNNGIGIWLKNSNQNMISNNSIHPYHETMISNNSIHPYHETHGIVLDYSNDNIISSNTITNGTYFGSACGIRIGGSNNVLYNNTIKNFMGGIYVSSPGNSIHNNIITNISHDGINLGPNNNASYNIISYTGPYGSAGVKTDHPNCIVTYNTISNNFHDGINMDNTFNNTISNNIIANNSGNGISPDFSAQITISGNYIYNNNENGIRLISRSHDNTVYNNSISLNRLYGISIEKSGTPLDPPENNYVLGNDFLQNNIGGASQAFDDSSNNVFNNNYWDEWVIKSQDNNKDNFLDDPYQIDGGAANNDLYPLAIPSHQLTLPVIIYPNGEESLQRTKTIQWTASSDCWMHEITYSVYYNVDGKTTWTLLAANLNVTTYDWDTTTVNDSSTYLIKVVAECFIGLAAEDKSDEVFTIENVVSMSTIPTKSSTTATSTSQLSKTITFSSVTHPGSTTTSTSDRQPSSTTLPTITPSWTFLILIVTIITIIPIKRIKQRSK